MMASKLKEHIRSRRLFYVWVLTYLVILFVTLMVSSVVAAVSLRILSEEVKRTNDSFLNQIKNLTDMNFKNMENTSHSILQSSSISKLNFAAQSEEENRQNIRDAIKDIAANSNNVEFLRSGLVVLGERDICLDSTGSYTKARAYDFWFSDCYPTYEEWETALFSGEHNGYEIRDGRNGEKKLFYIHSLNTSVFIRPKAVIIITINSNNIALYLNKIKGTEQSLAYLVNDDGAVIFRSRNDDAVDHFRCEENGALLPLPGFVLSSRNSAVDHISYVLSTPAEIYEKQIRNVRGIFVLCFSFLILFGLICSVYFSKRNYSPLRQFVERVSSSVEGLPEQNSKEFEFLEHAFQKILSDQERIHKKQALGSQQKVLADVLHGKYQAAEILSVLEKHGIPVLNECFSVVVFQASAANAETDEEFYNTEEVQFVISNVFSEIIGERAHCFYCDMDGLYVCVISSEKKVILPGLYGQIQYAADFLTEYLKMELIMGISETVDSPDQLPACYERATELIHYKFLEGGKSVFVYDQLSALNNQASTYCLDTEKKLIDSLQMGNQKLALAILDDIYAENVQGQTLRLETARMLMYQITSTILRAISALQETRDILIEQTQEWSDRLMRAETMEHFCQETRNVCIMLCDEVTRSKTYRSTSRMEEVERYIEENYTDANLSVGLIADEMGITINYLSKYFKDQSGVGLADYIINYRIDKAKILLRSTELKIKDIAEQVGFYNTNIFIRAFKRCETITPGQYRLGNAHQ